MSRKVRVESSTVFREPFSLSFSVLRSTCDVPGPMNPARRTQNEERRTSRRAVRSGICGASGREVAFNALELFRSIHADGFDGVNAGKRHNFLPFGDPREE